MMGGGAGMGGMDPSAMQNMMSNPSLKGLLGNPDFLQNAVNMINNPAMLSMIQ
jgi:hypothetical protein